MKEERLTTEELNDLFDEKVESVKNEMVVDLDITRQDLDIQLRSA